VFVVRIWHCLCVVCSNLGLFVCCLFEFGAVCVLFVRIWGCLCVCGSNLGERKERKLLEKFLLMNNVHVFFIFLIFLLCLILEF